MHALHSQVQVAFVPQVARARMRLRICQGESGRYALDVRLEPARHPVAHGPYRPLTDRLRPGDALPSRYYLTTKHVFA